MTKYRVLIVIMLSICLTPSLFSHPGRTDKNGGHNGPDGYHYHNGSGTTPKQPPAPAPVTEERFVLDSDVKDNIFHRPVCELIKGKRVINITVSEARGSQYKACTVCKPVLPKDNSSDILR